MIQNDFPLAIRPFKVLADRLGIDESRCNLYITRGEGEENY